MLKESIKDLRQQLGLSQQAFADRLGVTFATVNRWENGKAKPQKDRIERIRSLIRGQDSPSAEAPIQQWLLPTRLDFEGNPQAIKLVVDACRLQNGHLFNKAFGLELSRVVPLPHQRIAVYEHMLTQNPLRYLLADDAGAGKTIMTGLYIREMINRGRMKRVLICCPAGLTWNWRRELQHFFDLEFTVLRGSDFQKTDPLRESGKGLYIISVDTAATDAVRARLAAPDLEPFDLAVFDEAHKLSWTNPKRLDSKTQRYRLAEILSAQCPHLLLLTATPHMGKPFPYFALWRLLDSKVFSTIEALGSVPHEKRRRYFIRRLKEEMVDYKGLPIYKPRLCQTVNFNLSEGERVFYDAATEYLKWSYDTNKSINKNAAAMVVAVFQRRLASSAYAMVESLKRRREKLLKADKHESRISLERISAYLDSSTADEGESDVMGQEGDEAVEDAALSLAKPAGKQLEKELEYLDNVIALGEDVKESQRESKFLKLRELIESAGFQHQQLLIFTEHRDTLDYLKQRFEALGYSGQVASIHGAMDVEEREAQRLFFMPPPEKRRQSLPDADAPYARMMLATDAAGEGLNMQFAWVMVNYDIPWNPARLEQRMGRLHRFGQTHDEVRIFNLVAEGTREGDVLSTLLAKLDEARKELCTDKVFDVVGQQLQEISLRDLLRDSLYENAPYSAQKKLESLLATQKLRVTVEEQRKQASSYGDVAQRLGQLNSEIEIENFNRLLPAYVQNFVEHAAPLLGITIDGDVAAVARLGVSGIEGKWMRSLASDMRDGLPDFITVRRDAQVPEVDPKRIAFLRPGDRLFDALCEETVKRFKADVDRGGIFCDPGAKAPYFLAIYLCQVGCLDAGGRKGLSDLFEKRLIALRWNDKGEFEPCAPNHLLALLEAPRSLVWKAGTLLSNPEEQVRKADGYARSLAESTVLQQIRASLRAEATTRVEDLIRGYDYRSGELAERRSELSRRVRSGDTDAQPDLDAVKSHQSSLESEKASTLMFEERRAELAEVVRMERVAVALVVPDATPEAQEAFDKDIEAIAMRIARNYEIDRYQAKVVDVSSPVLAYGYDLQSHRPNGDRIAIEVKGRAGRGAVHLTDNEWPTAANLRDKYWLYVVFDCATEPKLFRVCDPIRLAFKTRTTFSLNAGEIIQSSDPS
jgi:SNF2 family DNA or RNA helicase